MISFNLPSNLFHRKYNENNASGVFLPNMFPCEGLEYLRKTKNFYIHPDAF